MRSLSQSWFLAAVLALAPTIANALPILHLSLLNPDQTVGPSDDVPIFARLTNDPLSTESAVGAHVIGLSVSYPPGTIPPYKFTFGGFTQFGSMSIGPADSFDFLFGTFAPNPGPIPIGIYHAGSIQLIYGDPIGLQVNALAHELVTINVPSVPEPSMALLIGTALIGAAQLRSRKRASSDG